MRGLFTGVLALSLMVGGAAHGQGLFGPVDPNSAASIALDLIGGAIIAFTAAGSIGALIAGIVVAVRRQAPRGRRRLRPASVG